MFAARSSNYAPLLDESRLVDQESTSDIASPSSPLFSEKKRMAKGVPWALVVVIVCSLFNIALSVFPTMLTLMLKKAPKAETLITRQNIHLLRRPNQYIGFDEIPRQTPPIDRQLTTSPILISLVDAAYPNAVFEDDFAAQMVHSGTITPDDRRVRVTPTMSTIFQFRAIDWGMEICELHVDLPETFSQKGHSGSLMLYRVNATIPLDASSLSYNTRPTRISKLGNIPLGNSTVSWHRKLNCAMDEVLSFELGCIPFLESGDDDSSCFVEWVQIKGALPAIHMVQRSTV